MKPEDVVQEAMLAVYLRKDCENALAALSQVVRERDEAFQEGARWMKELAARACEKSYMDAEWEDPPNQDGHHETSAQRARRIAARAIRALPLKDEP